ncbi:MAG: RNA 2',3'-cyclic phosphodiesterase, partial [Actinobacteria bacterium]
VWKEKTGYENQDRSGGSGMWIRDRPKSGQFRPGKFPVPRPGLAGDVPALTTLAQAVRRELRRARLPYDRKPFRPHLTIARPGERVTADDVAADRALLADYRGPTWPVTEMVLVRSYLGPRPRYERLATWSL